MAEQDQDTRQREKRVNQTEQHDESVLNPEIKDELDLSKKERRLIEKEKLKGMGMKKKLEYIWMYYKPAIFGVIIAIALIFGVKDSTVSDTDEFEQEIKEALGYGDDKYSKVEIGVNLTTDADPSEFNYTAQMAYVTQVQAGTIDIMVMPEELYQTLNENQAFVDLKELLGADNFEAFGSQTDTTHISITDSELAEKLGVSYEPMCIVVPYSAPDQENVVKWLETLNPAKN